MTRPAISVVLASGYHGPAGGAAAAPVRRDAALSRLDLVLASLRQQTIGCERFEVIVVDGGSADLSTVVARYAPDMAVRVVREPPRGVAHALNRSVAEAQHEIVFLGTDCSVLSATSLAGHAAAHQADPDGTELVACGRQYVLVHAALFRDITVPVIEQEDVVAFGDRHGDWIHRALDLLALDEQTVTAADVVGSFRKIELLATATPEQRDLADTLAGGDTDVRCPWLVMRFGNHSVRRELLDKVGHLDEVLDEHEGFCADLDLGLRMWRAGARFAPVELAASYDITGGADPAYHVGRATGLCYLLGKHRCAEVALLPHYLAGAGRPGLTVAEYGRQAEAAQGWFDQPPVRPY